MMAKFLEICKNPVLWAKTFVNTVNNETKEIEPWTARWYQAEMLLDTSPKKVARCGRRTGKCLPKWVKVMNPDTGELITIEELYRTKIASVVTMTGNENLITAHNCPVIYNGYKDVFRVTLSSGKIIDATGNHPLYTKNGWMEIDSLRTDDEVAVPSKLDFWGTSEVDEKTLNYAAYNLDSHADNNIPHSIFRLTKNQVSIFLKKLFEKSGEISRNRISFRARTFEFISGLSHLLLRFGILCRITRSKPHGEYTLTIDDTDSVTRLHHEILKEQTEAQIQYTSKPDIIFEKIVSIEHIGKHETYDLTVPVTHSFAANDIIVHNTETMCIDSLHKTNTIRSFRYIFAAPYEAQIRMIFNRISELINLSPYIKQEVVSNTKTPFEIKFKNGSSIYGASTGAGTSNGAVSLRGQRADAIALDESDYMNDADFDSILAIAGEREGISIFLSSTPTGARKRFWQCCTDKKMGYKEFHYPSTLNPNWSAKMEEEFRAQLSPSGYVHEILAEFGEQDTGVFNKEKLDKAMTFERYTYMPLTYTQEIAAKENNWNIDFMIPPSYMGRHEVYRPTPFRCCGVDFDKYGASSSILILDYLPEYNKFKVVRRIEVPKAEYSFDAAVNLIIEINNIYDPAFIYCDRGSGEITPSCSEVIENCKRISEQNR